LLGEKGDHAAAEAMFKRALAAKDGHVINLVRMFRVRLLLSQEEFKLCFCGVQVALLQVAYAQFLAEHRNVPFSFFCLCFLLRCDPTSRHRCIEFP
jgi:hypothetical protein